MYVCMYVFMYVCMYACMHVGMYVRMYDCPPAGLPVCASACLYLQTYAWHCMHACIACMHVSLSVCTYVCLIVSLSICRYASVFCLAASVHACTHLYAYVRIYACVHACTRLCWYAWYAGLCTRIRLYTPSLHVRVCVCKPMYTSIRPSDPKAR